MPPDDTASAEILLSILVPTWNRENYLRRLLAVLLPVLREHSQLELVISNNSSTDGTAAYLATLAGLERVRIYHQAVNLGATVNVAWLYGQARGKYLWLVGDDDMVEPDLIGTVCEMVRQEPSLGWVHLPHRWSGGVSPHASPCPSAVERRATGREFFVPYLLGLTFVTANVMNTKRVQAALSRLAFETNYWPMVLTMTATADHPAAVLNVCKIEAGDDITWGDVFHATLNFHMPLALMNCPVLSKTEKNACLRQRYLEQPEFLDRLIWLNPGLLLRIFRQAPQLCNLAFVGRVTRKTLRRIFSPRKPTVKGQGVQPAGQARDR